jgi:dTDP-4-dehydrorhamnose reductase
MNNLVLGSEGFLGKRLCKFLEEKKQNVVRVDIKINFPIFLERLNLYSPREFILETLSPKSCIDRWYKVLCQV